MNDAVRDLFEELNRPSAQRLKQVLRQRGIPYDDATVRAVVSQSTEKQLQAPAYKYQGKIPGGTGPNARWAIDTINLTSRPSKGYKYIVMAQDIFTRRVMAAPSESVSPEAVSRVFEAFVAEHGVPKELNSDSGAEYTSRPFTQVLERLQIRHRVKEPQDKNAIATLDNAIGRMKKALLITGGDWSGRVRTVVNGMNKTPHSHLMESAPNDVEGNDVLTFALQKEAAQDMAENNENIDKRKAALERTGAFRVEVPPKGFRRGHFATFGGEVHKIRDVEGDTPLPFRDRVRDSAGQEYRTKFTKAVPATSATVATPQTAMAGSTLTDNKQKRIMRQFAERVAVHVGRGGVNTLNNVSRYLNSLAGFKNAAREANIKQKHVIARTLRLFPELFVVRTSDEGGAATVRVVDNAPRRRLSRLAPP